MAALLGRNVVRTIIKDFCPSRISASNAHTKPIRYPQVSYNDMTKPEGPWKAKYDKMNAQYSRYMYAGLATLCVSVGIAFYVLDVFKYKELPHRNTPEGLAFLNPNPEVLADILK